MKITNLYPAPGERGYWTAIAKEMKEGDSIKIEARHVSALRYAIEKLGFAMRQESIGEGDYKRIWKVKR